MRRETILAYLAGVIDSDGTIGIKRSTYAMRVRKDAGQPVYSERVGIKQVEPQAIELLKKTFGGYRGTMRPGTKQSKPLHTWNINSRSAGKAIAELLPYLRIKRRQAENALALRALIGQGRGWPQVKILRGETMLGTDDFAQRVGCSRATVQQACRQGSIPSRRVHGRRLIPESFVAAYRQRRAGSGRARRSAEVSEQMQRCFERARELNRVGV